MNKKILVCDNDPDISELITLILTTRGYNVFTSENCDNLPEKIEKYDPDLIIMDLWIPEIGGEKATQLLKKSSEHNHIPVLIVSANNEIAAIAKRSGAEDYLPKPFAINTLVDKINSQLHSNVA